MIVQSIVLLMITAPAQAEPAVDAPAPTLAERVAAQPKAVRKFIARRTECNHWGGEEPYDADRRREIERAVRGLRCDRLDRDEVRLLRRYKGRSALIELLDAVRDEPGL